MTPRDKSRHHCLKACCFIAMTVTVNLGVVFLLVAFTQSTDGKLRFASYFGDHMVLQKAPERAVLWGYGPGDARVSVSLSGPAKQLKTSAVSLTEGIWRVTLDPVEAGGPYIVTVATEGSSATLTDVLFGDVWLCGGQSNMYFSTSQVFNAEQELAITTKYPHVRGFMAALNMSETEQTDLIQVELPWFVPTRREVGGFSAVCWLFGRYMYDTLKYPIGLVESCWGGTPVEVWSSSRALKQCGLERSKDSLGGPQINSVLWNSMIHPLLNMTIKGALWYQGERNTEYHRDKYNCSFPAMIDDWRMMFHQGSGGQTALDFPFGFVQLSTSKKDEPDDGFPEIRWHQTADTGYVPNSRMKKTFMAVAMDLPDETSPYGMIHPRDKQDVAFRLTLGARAVAYGDKNVPFLGPFPSKILSTQSRVNITFDQKVYVTPSKDIFEICCTSVKAPCGPKSRWVAVPIMQWDMTTVQLSASFCPPTDEVAALRYAWRDWPCSFKACPIYSADGILPAPPFIINHYAANGKDIWESF